MRKEEDDGKSELKEIERKRMCEMRKITRNGRYIKEMVEGRERMEEEGNERLRDVRCRYGKNRWNIEKAGKK